MNKLYCYEQSAHSSYGTMGYSCEFGFLEDVEVDPINGEIKVFVGIANGSAIDERRSTRWLHFLFSTKPDDITLHKEPKDWEYLSRLTRLRECTTAEVESFKKAVQISIDENIERAAELKQMLKALA